MKEAWQMKRTKESKQEGRQTAQRCNTAEDEAQPIEEEKENSFTDHWGSNSIYSFINHLLYPSLIPHYHHHYLYHHLILLIFL